MKKRNHLQTLIALSSLALSSGILQGQQDDPFQKEKGQEPIPSTPELFDTLTLPRQIFTTVEIFSLPADEAARLHRQKISDAAIYESIVKMVAEKKADQEFLSSLISLPGQRATRKATQQVDGSATDGKTPPAGLTIEIEGQLGMPSLIPLTKKGAALLDGQKKFTSNDPFGAPDPKNAEALKIQNQKLAEAVQSKDLKSITYIELRITPTLVKQVATMKTGAELLDTEEVSTGLTTTSGVPLLLGTFTPVSQLKAPGQDQQEVWLAFVTATVKVVGL